MFIRPPSHTSEDDTRRTTGKHTKTRFGARNNEHKFGTFCTPANALKQRNSLFAIRLARKIPPYCTPVWDP